MNDLKKAIQRLSKTNTGFDALIELAKVVSVNEGDLTCTVVLVDNEDLVIEGVKLKPVIAELDLKGSGFVLIPQKGSFVLIGQINNNENDLFVVQTSQVAKLMLDAGSAFNLLLNLQSGGLDLSGVEIAFNKGLNGGLPLINPLLGKINQLEKKLNDLTEAYNDHKHAGVATGAAVSGIHASKIAKIAELTKLDEIENKAIKQ